MLRRLAAVCATCLALPTAASAAPRAGDLIVVRDAHTTSAQALAGADIDRITPVAGLRADVVRPDGVSAAEAAEQLRDQPGVRYVEPNRVWRVQSNDEFYTRLWALENTGQAVAGFTGLADADIDAPEAWQVTSGAGQAVAVVDSGLDTASGEFAGRVWTNPGETGNGRETNGVDDDANGYIDDVSGWDMRSGDANPLDSNGHGTHVAGTIAANRDNTFGVAGVAPEAQVVPLRVMGADGTGLASDIAEAFDYAAENNIRVVNASLGGEYSQLVADVIAKHPDTLFVVAAGNGGADGIGDDAAVDPESFPCSLTLPNILCVTATDNRDTLAPFANRSKTAVDLAAPGVDIGSTWLFGDYYYSSGTSMAAPHAAGVAALALAAAPNAGVAQLKSALIDTGDPVAALSAHTLSGRRLNANAAVRALMAQPADGDSDGHPDTQDNCPDLANTDQADADGDGTGDVCDPTPQPLVVKQPDTKNPDTKNPQSKPNQTAKQRQAKQKKIRRQRDTCIRQAKKSKPAKRAKKVRACKKVAKAKLRRL